MPERLSIGAMALLPLMFEAVALALCLGLWLKMNVFMALTGALILTAVCPAVIGATMHEWQSSRLGTQRGLHSQLQSNHINYG